MTTQTLWILVAVIVVVVLIALVAGLTLARRRRISLREPDELATPEGEKAPPKANTYKPTGAFDFSAGSGGGTGAPTLTPGESDRTTGDDAPKGGRGKGAALAGGAVVAGAAGAAAAAAAKGRSSTAEPTDTTTAPDEKAGTAPTEGARTPGASGSPDTSTAGAAGSTDTSTAGTAAGAATTGTAGATGSADTASTGSSSTGTASTGTASTGTASTGTSTSGGATSGTATGPAATATPETAPSDAAPAADAPLVDAAPSDTAPADPATERIATTPSSADAAAPADPATEQIATTPRHAAPADAAAPERTTPRPPGDELTGTADEVRTPPRGFPTGGTATEARTPPEGVPVVPTPDTATPPQGTPVVPAAEDVAASADTATPDSGATAGAAPGPGAPSVPGATSGTAAGSGATAPSTAAGAAAAATAAAGAGAAGVAAGPAAPGTAAAGTAAPGTAAGTAAAPTPTEPIAPAEGRLERLRGNLAGSRNAFGQSLLGLLGGGELDEESWEDVEATLLKADLGPETTAELVETLRAELARNAVRTPAQAREVLRAVLTDALGPDMNRSIRALPHDGRPGVLLVVGVNGTGKTTTTGKLARVLVAGGRHVVLGAADTFRAAAAEQLMTWGERAGAVVVRGAEGADPAAVAFDAVKRGTADGADAVLLDTAGRLHTKTGLMDELGKVKRVVERQSEVDEVILVLDATTGQNGMIQARVFGEVVKVTGIALTKLDGTAKGGIVFRVQRELGVPVKLVGLGEGPDDLAPFEPAAFVDALLG